MLYKRSPKQYFLRSSGFFLNSAKKLHSGREWHEWQISALVERARGQFLECVYSIHPTFVIIFWFLCKTFVGCIQKYRCCLCGGGLKYPNHLLPNAMFEVKIWEIILNQTNFRRNFNIKLNQFGNGTLIVKISINLYGQIMQSNKLTTET